MKRHTSHFFSTTQSDFPRPLAVQEHSVVLEGSSLDHSHCVSRAPEATVAAEVEVACIADAAAAEVAPVVGMAAGIGAEVVGVVERVENTTPGSRVEGQRAPSTIGDVQEARQGFAVEWERIVEVVASRIVVVDGGCWELVAVEDIENIVVGMQRRQVLAGGRVVEHSFGVG